MCGLFGALTASPAVIKVCGKGHRVRADVQDALRCAALAWLFANHPEKLLGPTKKMPKEEGWIWLPADCMTANAIVSGVAAVSG